MKTIEEKAKAYDELISKLKEWHDGLQDRSPAKDALELILQQFRESEDERIRKALVKQFGGCIKDYEFCHTGFTYAEITAWLEKQKEHVPENEESGTRKEQKPAEYGEDERIRKMCIAAVNIAASADGGLLHSEASECLAWLEEQKDKNCLACDQHLKGYIAGRKATEEEKQKEQKPVEYPMTPNECYKPVQKQDYSGLNDLERAIHRGFLCAGVENVPVTIIKETAQECMAKIKPVECDIVNHLDNPGNTAMADTLRRFRPQKQEWSEEDDVMFNTAKKIIWESEASEGTTNKVISWLGGKLRSLRPQPQWKPSEEQMNTIGLAIQVLNSSGHNSLCCKPNALRDDLLKLK